MKLIEWFFRLFFAKQAKLIEAERDAKKYIAVKEYQALKKKQEKELRRYSTRKSRKI